jgi:DNA mismatch repair ATPase MutS
MLEMKETAFICNNASHRSLILLDELGRATSNEDGVAIAWAVSEHLLAKKTMTFFVSHYPQLCRLEDAYPTVQNQHLKASVLVNDTNSISYTHKVQPGPCMVTAEYGVEMASSCGWPDEIVLNVRV